MKEVLKKIDEMVSLLENKLKSTEVLNRQLSTQKLDAEEKGKIITATEKRLSAKERVYKKYDNFDKLQKELEARSEEVIKKESKIAKESEELEVVREDIKEQNKKLNARKATLSTQALALKQKEIDFDKKRQELKDVISGAAVKNLLK